MNIIYHYKNERQTFYYYYYYLFLPFMVNKDVYKLNVSGRSSSRTPSVRSLQCSPQSPIWWDRGEGSPHPSPRTPLRCRPFRPYLHSRPFYVDHDPPPLAVNVYCRYKRKKAKHTYAHSAIGSYGIPWR